MWQHLMQMGLAEKKCYQRVESIGVYTFVSDNHGGAYGLGGGLFVDIHGALKYETLSKAKLALLNK